MTDALKRLSDEGVAIWLDDMSRRRITTGNLAELIDQQHVVGATTNPSIFQKAIIGDTLYDPQVADLVSRGLTPDAFPRKHLDCRLWIAANAALRAFSERPIGTIRSRPH